MYSLLTYASRTMHNKLMDGDWPTRFAACPARHWRRYSTIHSHKDST
jgi:hypothetical protein